MFFCGDDRRPTAGSRRASRLHRRDQGGLHDLSRRPGQDGVRRHRLPAPKAAVQAGKLSEETAGSHIAVLETTDDQGLATLRLPPGKYRMENWPARGTSTSSPRPSSSSERPRRPSPSWRTLARPASSRSRSWTRRPAQGFPTSTCGVAIPTAGASGSASVRGKSATRIAWGKARHGRRRQAPRPGRARQAPDRRGAGILSSRPRGGRGRRPGRRVPPRRDGPAQVHHAETLRARSYAHGRVKRSVRVKYQGFGSVTVPVGDDGRLRRLI